MSDDEMLPVQPGDVIADKYKVERSLGVGGMGAVVAAKHLELGELVAIKFMRPEFCHNKSLLTRFQREARGTFKLKSEHVARVFDIGTLPSGAPYFVMEYLHGCDLRTLVKRRGRIAVHEAAEYVRQACVGLAEAHAIGMVHRDLKPANLFLTHRPDGSPLVKVLDFGVAKFLSPEQAGDGQDMTTTRSVMGSRRYMAPEQMLTPKDVDERADVWSLGIILYQLVSGKMPFGAETMELLVLAITQQAARPLREVREDLPAAFEAVVMRCLEKERQRRHPSAADLGRALGAFTRADEDDVTLTQATRAADDPFTSTQPAAPVTLERSKGDTPIEQLERSHRAQIFGVSLGVALFATFAAITLAVARDPARVSRWASSAVAQQLVLGSRAYAAEPPSWAPPERPAIAEPAPAIAAPPAAPTAAPGRADRQVVVAPVVPGIAPAASVRPGGGGPPAAPPAATPKKVETSNEPKNEAPAVAADTPW